MNRTRKIATGFLVLGGLLTALGLLAFALSGGTSVTSLIPTFIGLPIAGAALMARRGASTVRWTIVAALLAMLGAAGSLRGLAQLPALVSGAEISRPLAVIVQSVMAILCIAFLVPSISALSTKRFPDGRLDRR